MEGMKEYIERAAIHELVKRIPKYEMFNYDRTEALLGINPDDVDFGVDKIPTADVVEVVRCGQCKYSGPASKLSQKYGAPGVLTCHGPLCNRRNVTETDFCSRGARMDKEGEHEAG